MEQSPARVTSLVLKRLTSSEVVKNWQPIAAFATASYSGPAERRDAVLAEQFAQIKDERQQVWGVIVDGPKIAGIMVTAIRPCAVLELVSFWICTAIPDALWPDALKSLDAWARENGCEWVQGITPVLGVARLAERMGFEKGYLLRKAV